jgi:Gas vesicle synthesis protein GvpL/GvpF
VAGEVQAVSPLYLYALLAEAPAGPGVPGIAGESMRFVSCHGVLAAVGDLAVSPALDADALRAHDAAVRRLAASTLALLPARFGSVSPDEAALCEGLGPRIPALRAALESVRGCDQMTLRFATEAEAPAREPAASAPEPTDATGGPGTRYLRARRHASADLREWAEAARVLDALAPLVRAERRESHDRPPLLGSVYHLVARASLDAYRAALADAIASAAIRVTSSGPWPPYAFVPDERA